MSPDSTVLQRIFLAAYYSTTLREKPRIAALILLYET
jgi:hypothetical protein